MKKLHQKLKNVFIQIQYLWQLPKHTSQKSSQIHVLRKGRTDNYRYLGTKYVVNELILESNSDH